MTTSEPAVRSKPVTRAGPAARLLYAFCRVVVVGVCRAFWRLTIEGKEHVPEGPFVLAPVHRSNIDTFVVAAITRRRFIRRR